MKGKGNKIHRKASDFQKVRKELKGNKFGRNLWLN